MRKSGGCCSASCEG